MQEPPPEPTLTGVKSVFVWSYEENEVVMSMRSQMTASSKKKHKYPNTIVATISEILFECGHLIK